MRHAYMGFLIVAALVAVALLIANQWAVVASRQWDQYRMRRFLDGQAVYENSRYDLPSAVGIVHHDALHLAEKKNILLLGSSQVRMGIWPDALVVPEGWHFTSLGMGTDTQSSLRLMVNYITEVGGHAPDRSDVVVMQLWWLMPKAPEDERVSNSILKPNIELFKDYHVDDQMHVHGTVWWPIHELRLIRYRIYVAFSYRLGWPQFEPKFNLPTLYYLMKYISTGEPTYVYRSHRPTPEENTEWLESFAHDTTEHTTFPGIATEQLMQLITDLSAQTNVVIVNSYHPSYHRKYPLEQKYEAWVTSTFRPELEKRHIPFIDLENAMPDDEYIDYGHLTLPGRIRYTKLLMEQLSHVLPKQDVSANPGK